MTTATPVLRVVHKYEVFHGPHAETEMPEGAELLHVACDPSGEERVWIWALVNPAGAPRTRRIGYFGTGEGIPTDYESVGTAVDRTGALVWHVFAERVER